MIISGEEQVVMAKRQSINSVKPRPSSLVPRHWCLPVVISLILMSCARVDDQVLDFQQPAEIAGVQKFPAWTQNNALAGSANVNKAVQDLLRQADALIGKNKMELASEKLERLLRIEPSYAQAWSRLAWIALQTNRARRTQQMAQRSNSVAYGDKHLKVLNWSFIRQAGHQSGDDDLVTKAEEMIKLLDDSTGGS